MSNVALIPARAGSKRLPGKNTKLLAGKPLILWTVEAAVESGCYDHVFVATDDSQIVDLLGDIVGNLPDSELATHPCARVRIFWRQPVSDVQPDTEWASEFVDWWGTEEGDLETFSILRPTSPFRSAETICRAWKQWDEVKDQVDSLRAVRPVREHPGKMWDVVDTDMAPFSWSIDDPQWERGGVTWNSPTQSLPTLHIQTAGLEIAHARVLPDSISGDRVAPFIVEGAEALDVNTPEDWVVAEAYADGRLTLDGKLASPAFR